MDYPSYYANLLSSYQGRKNQDSILAAIDRFHQYGDPVSPPSIEQLEQSADDWDRENTPGVGEALGRGIAHGTMGLAQSVNTGLQYVGNRAGSETLADIGETGANYWGNKADKLAPPKTIQGNVWDNPELLGKASWWAYNVGDMAPSLAASLLPGAAVGKAVKGSSLLAKFGPKIVERLARIGTAMTGGVTGGALEGSSTYREVLANGGSEEEAARSAELMTLASAALNAISTDKMLSGASGVRDKIVKYVVSGATEGITEGLEEPAEVIAKAIGGKMTGQEWPSDFGEQMKQAGKDALTVAPVAGLTGVGGAAFGGGHAQSNSFESGMAKGLQVEPKPLTDTSTDIVNAARGDINQQTAEQINRDPAYTPFKSAEESAGVFGKDITDAERLRQSPRGLQLLNDDLRDQDVITPMRDMIGLARAKTPAEQSADVFTDHLDAIDAQAVQDGYTRKSPIGARGLQRDLVGRERESWQQTYDNAEIIQGDINADESALYNADTMAREFNDPAYRARVENQRRIDSGNFDGEELGRGVGAIQGIPGANTAKGLVRDDETARTKDNGELVRAEHVLPKEAFNGPGPSDSDVNTNEAVRSGEQHDGQNDEQSRVDQSQRSFIEGKVSQLGSVESVDKFYDGTDNVSKYARQYAREVFQVDKRQPTEKANTPKQNEIPKTEQSKSAKNYPEGVRLTSKGNPYKKRGAQIAADSHTKATGEQTELVELGGKDFGWMVVSGNETDFATKAETPVDVNETRVDEPQTDLSLMGEQQSTGDDTTGVDRRSQAQNDGPPRSEGMSAATDEKDEGQLRAKPGGEYGPNGEWYDGGKFIATTSKPKTKKWKSPAGRVQVDNDEWTIRPDTGDENTFVQPMHGMLSGTAVRNEDGTFSENTNLNPSLVDIEHHKENVGLWNKGARWAELDGETRKRTGRYLDKDGNNIDVGQKTTHQVSTDGAGPETAPASNQPSSKREDVVKSKDLGESTTPKASAPEKVKTIAGPLTLSEFEREETPYEPWEVTKEDWVDLQRAERRRLGQDEGGDNKQAPYAEYEEYHKDRVKEAVEKGEDVDERVLADYPELTKPDRRKDSARRKAVSEMSQEEMKRELLTDYLTGLGNKRAYEESTKKKHQISIDADALKWVNDNLGHSAGDELLKMIGNALKQEGLDAYHISGDEYYLQGDDATFLEESVKKAYIYLKNNPIEVTLPDGTEALFTGGFSYGRGQNIEEAESRLKLHKTERELSGERSVRGQEPTGSIKRLSEGNKSEDQREDVRDLEKESDLPPGVSKEDIPYTLAYDAHRGSSFTPDKRAESERNEYVDHLKHYYEKWSKLANTDEKKSILSSEFARYRDRYLSMTKALLSANSRTMSSMITGPSNFPTRSNQKKLDTAHKRLTELLEWSKKAQRAIERKLTGSEAIKTEDPDAVEKLKAKLENAEKAQETMKAANKIVKKKGLSDDEKITELTKLGLSEKQSKEILEPDFAGRVGFASYALTNNNANIKRLKERIAEVSQKQSEEQTEIEFDGGSIIDNPDVNRVQIFFEGKPDEAVRKELKSNGFRWAPSVGVWQRHRSNAALYLAKKITGATDKGNASNPTVIGRDRPYKMRSLDIQGPNGSRITGYEWAYRKYDYVDKRGEDRVGRESDWDNSEVNDDTGREVVHKFHIEDSEGNAQVVSLETAIKKLGYGENETAPIKNLASSLKSLAKASMKLDQAKVRLDGIEKERVETKNKESEIKKGGYPEPKFDNSKTFNLSVGDIERRYIESKGRWDYQSILDSMRSMWVDNRIKDAGLKTSAEISRESTNIKDEIQRTERIIKRLEVKIEKHKAGGDSGAKLSQSESTPTKKADISELSPKQRRTLNALTRNGKVEIVTAQDADKLISQGAESYGQGERVQGVFLNGKAYVIPENIESGSLWPVIRHEAGVHMGQLLQGNKGFDRLKRAFEVKRKEQTPTGEAIRKAFDSVPEDTKAEHVTEEAMAYLVEQAPEIGFAKRILNFLKRVLVKLGVSESIFTADDFVAMADAALKREAKASNNFGPPEPLFSKSQESGTKQIEEHVKSFEEDTVSALDYAGRFIDDAKTVTKGLWKDRDYKHSSEKKTISWFEKSFDLVSHYAKKIPAFKRAYEHALRNSEIKTMIEQELTHGVDENGNPEKYVETFKTFRKKFKEEYSDLSQYLDDTDKRQVFWNVEEIPAEDLPDGWTMGFVVVDPKGKKTSHTFKDDDSAWGKVYALESDAYVDKGGSYEGARVLKRFRTINDRAYKMRVKGIEEIRAHCQKHDIPEPTIAEYVDGKTVHVDLKTALAEMGSHRGYYMPRIRKQGDWMVWAEKEGESPMLVMHDFKTVAIGHKAILEKDGYKVTVKQSNRLSEDLYANLGSVLAQQAAINKSLEHIERGNKTLNLGDLNITGEWEKSDYVVAGEILPEYGDALVSIGAVKKKKTKILKGGGTRFWVEYRFEDADKEIEEKAKDLIFKTKGIVPDIAFQIAEAMASQYADILRMRGSRSAMIARKHNYKYKPTRDGKFSVVYGANEKPTGYEYDTLAEAISKAGDLNRQGVVRGYEEDAITRVTRSAYSLAGGEAKKKTALSMIKAITGHDIEWAQYKEIKEFDGDYPEYESYLADNNLDYVDRDAFDAIREGEDEKPDYETYLSFVKDRSIDPAKQKTAHAESMALFQDIMRNEERVDRVIGTLKGLAVIKYLGFRVAAPVVNVTNMVVGVPATMNGYGKIPLRNIHKLIGSAYTDYYRFKKGTLENEDMGRVFQEIEKRGWDQAYFNQEAVSVLQGRVGYTMRKAIDMSMALFSWSEKLNRVASISAAYKGLIKSKPELTFEERMRLAKEISDKAHGVYEKANRPSAMRGGGIGANAMQTAYVFKTFSHNFMATMFDLGFREKEAKAALWMAFSPVIFGVGSSVGAKALISAIGKAMGSDDPEEDFYRAIESNFGTGYGDVARFGIPGLAGHGVSLKGSLSIGIADLPTSFKDLAGAPGSVLVDIYEGLGDMAKGNVSKGSEKILPLAFGAPLKAIREATEGITTRSNAPVMYNDSPLKADSIDAFLRFFSFNPARIAGARERLWADRKKQYTFQDMRSEIYARLKKYHLGKVKNTGDLKDIELMITAYNAKAKKSGQSLITRRSIKSVLKRAKVE